MTAWVVCRPLYTLNNQGPFFFATSNHLTPTNFRSHGRSSRPTVSRTGSRTGSGSSGSGFSGSRSGSRPTASKRPSKKPSWCHCLKWIWCVGDEVAGWIWSNFFLGDVVNVNGCQWRPFVARWFPISQMFVERSCCLTRTSLSNGVVLIRFWPPMVDGEMAPFSETKPTAAPEMGQLL